MSNYLIRQYSSSIVNGFISRVASLKYLDHDLLKGELKEIFTSNVLNLFLTDQFGIGSGVVTNKDGKQSNQTDIIIYDKRMVPPFIKGEHLGVFPIECVLATIEIKTNLGKRDLEKAELSAKKLLSEVLTPEIKKTKPTCAVIGFQGAGCRDIKMEDKGKKWLKKSIKYLTYISLANRYTWINMESGGWSPEFSDHKTNNEFKRFIAVLLDNVRTRSEERIKLLKDHNDWLGAYIREPRG